MRIEYISDITDKSFGGKAYGLSLLVKNGLCIPETCCIEPTASATDFDDTEFQNDLRGMLTSVDGKYSVAVRSSSLIEDTLTESMAGHFLTRMGVYSFDELIRTIKDVYLSGDKMGIIIQEMIVADLSGVFFSSDPITFSKKNGVLSYVQGMGEALVSGDAHSVDLTVAFDKPLEDPVLNTLVKNVKAMEIKLGYPLDVEWCIKDGRLFYLQCRPITSITSIKSGFYGIDDLSSLPAQLCQHDKIKLRLEAKQTDTFISNAFIHVENNSTSVSKCEEMTCSTLCRGYSVVIIYPRRISDKVIRSFVGSETNISQSIGRCYRYGIRSYPEHKDLNACIKALHEKAAAEEYWITVTIIQEVFDALYTGILQRLKKGYVIEVTKGHFLTKGRVLTSQYYAENKRIKSRHEVHQNIWYRIIQGHVIECFCGNEQNSFVTLKDCEINSIIEAFDDIIGDSDRIIEFGMIRHDEKLVPYLIDFVDSKDHVQSTDFEEGIISSGRRKGVMRHINDLEDSLDTHFYDGREAIEKISEDIIFACETPNISLLNVLDRYDNSRIAFVFSDGSILCHLAVVLRERGIPAIRIGEQECRDNEVYIIDAETPGLRGKERLIHE